jgi:hypothetical protein
MDIVTRYFLRRQALALKRDNTASQAAYRRALAEVTFAFVVMPAIGVLAFFGLSSINWLRPALEQHFPWLSIRLLAVVLWVLLFVIGNAWFGRRFKQYLSDPGLCRRFDSARDRRIAFWQKMGSVVLCGLVVPSLGLLMSRL